jgi:hypothetical protein
MAQGVTSFTKNHGFSPAAAQGLVSGTELKPRGNIEIWTSRIFSAHHTNVKIIDHIVLIIVDIVLVVVKLVLISMLMLMLMLMLAMVTVVDIVLAVGVLIVIPMSMLMLLMLVVVLPGLVRVVILVFWDRAIQAILSELLVALTMAGQNVKDITHCFVVRPPGFHEEHHIILSVLVNCAWKWIVGQPSADYPCFQRGGDIARQEDPEYLNGFALSEGPSLGQDGRDSRGPWFGVLVEEIAQTSDQGGEGLEVL